LNGTWSLIAPDDELFSARAVNGVFASADSTHDPIAQLRGWGFNALGAAAAGELRDEGLPFVATVDFSDAVSPIRAEGIRLPDVFDPEWGASAMLRASAVCPKWSDRRDLIGWMTDDALGWGGADGSGRSTLLQVCLSLEPSFAAYHAAWEYVLAAHAGQMSRVSRAWGTPIENKGVVRELTRGDRGLVSPGFLRDNVTWTREFARRYFAGASAAIRAHDNQHLILGAREAAGIGGPTDGSAWLAECVFPLVDVAWVHTRNVGRLAVDPQWAGNFSWAAPSYWNAPARSRARAVTAVERMLRQGRASLRAVIAHPAVVGYSWDAWVDEPAEQPPFARGLVHRNHVEAREHTELLADLNHRVDTLRPIDGGVR